VVVGSGTVVPEGDRGGSCIWVEMGPERIMVDCGPGAVQGLARFGLPWQELDHLVLTHFHGDHVGALPGLFFALKHARWPASRERALHVWGPVGTERLFRTLADALGEYLLDPGFPVEIHQGVDGEEELGPGVRLSTRPTPHTDESRAVRFDGDGASAGCTGDTGRCPELGEFLAGVDVLVAECSLPDDEVTDNHLSPSRVAEIAAAARPGMLVLTHVYPHFRRERDLRTLVGAAGWAGPVEIASDGDEHPLGRR